MSFYREAPIKAIRNPRPCLACGQRIGRGEPALGCSGIWEGDFWSGTYHTDCRKAELALNDLHDTMREGEFFPLSDIDREDHPWLVEQFPKVAARMGIALENRTPVPVGTGREG